MSYKLLLAEDSLAIQQVVQLAFTGEDVDVVVVDDGNAAIAAIEREPPDIVLADASLPGTDGYDLAACIGHRAAESSLPVVLLTGAFEPVDQDRANASGCRDILVKPFVPRELVTRVMMLLDPAYVAPAPEAEAGEAASFESGAGDARRPEGGAREPMHVGPQPEPIPVRSEPAPEPIDVTPVPDPEPVESAPAPEPIVVRAAPEPLEMSPAPEPTALAHRPILAQAFATFLAAERELAPRSGGVSASIASASAIPPDFGDSVKRELTRRVRRRLTKGFVRDMAAQVVAKTVDRVVREELARMNVRPPSE
ncbi:MAG: response regulator [Acidobacteria bacterium]|nr:response regulator [Acidobacteriota bacterium]MYJ03579.1 response regulator [Acidobacteriota bacterium]